MPIAHGVNIPHFEVVQTVNEGVFMLTEDYRLSVGTSTIRNARMGKVIAPTLLFGWREPLTPMY